MNTIFVLTLGGYAIVRRQRIRDLALRILFDERTIILVAAAAMILIFMRWQVRQELRRVDSLRERLMPREDWCENVLIALITPLIIGKYLWWDLRRRWRARR